MKRIFIAFTAILCATSANAASPNLAINDFDSETLTNCVAGEDLGIKLGMSNPLTLIGNLVFTSKGQNGKTTLNRQPMALPTVVADAGSPDQTTCSITMRATLNGSLNILGVSAAAKKDELYSINARLLTRQTLATVVENGLNVPVFTSDLYAPRFLNAIQRRPNSENFFLVDNINVYLIEVERYRKVGKSMSGLIAVFSGAGNYQKDESFKGVRFLVTGDTIPLDISMFRTQPAVPSVATLPAPSDILATLPASKASELPASKASELSESLKAAADNE